MVQQDISTKATHHASQVVISSKPGLHGTTVDLWCHWYPDNGMDRFGEHTVRMSMEQLAARAPDLVEQVRVGLSALTEMMWEMQDEPSDVPADEPESIPSVEE
jgi:hypothetical protein